MVHQIEEGSSFHTQSFPHEEIDQMEIPSETSIFLPEEDLSDNGDGGFSRAGSTSRISERRTSNLSGSRNLGILVISTDALSVDRDKSMGIDISSERNGKFRDIEEAQKLSHSLSENATSVEVSKKSGCRSYLGILLTLTSGLVFTIGGIIVRYLKSYHPFTLAIFRFQGILLPSLCMMLYAYYAQNVPVFEPLWPLTDKQKLKRVLGLLLRSAFGTTALFLHFYALQTLDVADALVIGSCQPVFVTLAAYFFLGEVCGVFPVFTAALTIVGVGIIARPPILTGEESFDTNTLVGAGYSMSSMLTATMVFVIIRFLKDVHVSVMTFVLGCWGTMQSIICSAIIGEFTFPQTLEHWLLAIALAVITLLGQVTLTLALQCEQAGNVAVVRTCDCLFAFLLQFIFLNTLPDLFSLTGASIIIFCVLLTAFRKWVYALPKDHPTRKRFFFVTM